MRIMHYFLGFPPYRTGGLTKYAIDIMKGQLEDGHVVMAIWPGKIRIISSKVSVKKRKNLYDIENYEIINPLPVPLDEGINSVDKFMKKTDVNIYTSFLEKTKPDVIHIHTLMGLHREFIEAANILKIKSIFTTHDYFGICPKVNLYRNGKACENDHECMDCVSCNKNALPIFKIFLLQTHIYQNFKNSLIIKKIRKIHRSNFFHEERYITINNEETRKKASRYKELRNFYIGILKDISFIHFNSSVTKNVYNRYFVSKNNKVISITHKDIDDNRGKINTKKSNVIRYTYLGSGKPAKGFDVIRKAFDEVWMEGKHDICLNLFFQISDPAKYMNISVGGFEYSQLLDIFNNTDILLAPSVWYETFGFTVLEALSFGIPVIISENVGARDIVSRGGIIIEPGSVCELKRIVQKLDMESINKMHNNIMRDTPIKLYRTLLDETYNIYLL